MYFVYILQRKIIGGANGEIFERSDWLLTNTK